jgi:hypothetical protein
MKKNKNDDSGFPANISEEDVHLFYKLHPALLWFVNRRLRVLEESPETPAELRGLGADKAIKVRDELLKNLHLIDEFIKENPFGFSGYELDIISGWKNLVSRRFFIVKTHITHAVFLDDGTPAKAYAVKGLTDLLEFSVPFLPFMVDAVLLPFKGEIIYDGFLYTHNISFGSGMRRDMNETYQEAKTEFGLIKTLPFLTGKGEGDAEKLRRYMATEIGRRNYEDEISKLVRKSRDLALLYHQENGSVYSRVWKKNLRENGICNGWFAILDDTPIASETSLEELENIVKKIIPKEKRDFVFVFQMKGK